MNNFFTSEHCVSQVHCRICRSVIEGACWRAAIHLSFQDVKEDAFTCPKQKPWIEGGPSLLNIDQYKAIKEKIQQAGHSGVWVLLKDELRLIEEFMELHSTNPECWKQRQRTRLISYYEKCAQS